MSTVGEVIVDIVESRPTKFPDVCWNFPGFWTVFPAAWYPHFQAESVLSGVSQQQAQVIPQSEFNFVRIFDF